MTDRYAALREAIERNLDLPNLGVDRQEVIERIITVIALEDFKAEYDRVLEAIRLLEARNAGSEVQG